jgi:phosphatidylcholine synthase
VADAGGRLSPPPTALQRAAAWGVHLYTASGALTALAALLATSEGRFTEAFWWLYVAVAIDASDGVLARAARVK